MAEKTVPDFPPFTLTIMRALCALTVLHPGAQGQDVLIRCLDTLFHACWVEQKATNKNDVLASVLTSVLGADETAKREWLNFLP